MNSSNKEYRVVIFDSFGRQDASVILPDVIDQICNHQTKMDGSGLVRAQKLDQQANATLAIGVIPAATDRLNPTIVKRPKAMTNLVCRF